MNPKEELKGCFSVIFTILGIIVIGIVVLAIVGTIGDLIFDLIESQHKR